MSWKCLVEQTTKRMKMSPEVSSREEPVVAAAEPLLLLQVIDSCYEPALD